VQVTPTVEGLQSSTQDAYLQSLGESALGGKDNKSESSLAPVTGPQSSCRVQSGTAGDERLHCQPTMAQRPWHACADATTLVCAGSANLHVALLRHVRGIYAFFAT